MTKRALALATLAVLTALAGCGDDSDDGGGGASGASAGTNGGSSGEGGASGQSGEGGAGGQSGEGGASGQSGEGGTSGGSGGTGGGGSGGMGGGGDDTPIAMRESDGTFTCTASEELKNLKPLVWGYSGGDLITTSTGDTWLVRTEGESEDPFGAVDYALLASKIDASGAIAEGTTIPVDDASLITSPRAVALADGALAVLWLENAQLRMAVLDADGEITIAPKAVAMGDELMDAAGLRVARGMGGELAAVWSNNFEQRTYIAITDADGSEATPKAFDAEMSGVQIAAAEDGGFVALWMSFDPDFMDPRNAFFSTLDATGAMVGEPQQQLSDITETGVGSSFGGGELALTAVDGGYLVAWLEGSGGDFETGTGAYSVIRVQRVSENGEPEGPAVLVDDEADDVDQVEPSFVAWGSSIALFWARGSHIYICAGCIPDHSVNMVLIDPATFDPRSEIVTIEPPPTGGGLLQRHVATSGEDTLLMTVGIQFHVHSEPGLAALQCVGE